MLPKTDTADVADLADETQVARAPSDNAKGHTKELFGLHLTGTSKLR